MLTPFFSVEHFAELPAALVAVAAVSPNQAGRANVHRALRLFYGFSHIVHQWLSSGGRGSPATFGSYPVPLQTWHLIVQQSLPSRVNPAIMPTLPLPPQAVHLASLSAEPVAARNEGRAMLLADSEVCLAALMRELVRYLRGGCARCSVDSYRPLVHHLLSRIFHQHPVEISERIYDCRADVSHDVALARPRHSCREDELARHD